MIRAETKRSIDGLLTDNLPCPINKTIKTIGLKQDIYHREGRGGEDFGGGHMVLGGKGGGISHR